MQRPEPLVSVVIPVFNGERFLAEALDTVFDQTHRPLEVIAVDDGSTDGTPHVVARYGTRVRYVRQENAGASSARNRGIALATGEFVALLDCDDLWEREKTARQLARFAARPALGACATHMANFWTDEVRHELDALQGSRLTEPQPNVGSSLMVRRALFERFGMLDPTMKHRDIQEWVTRLTGEGIETETMPDVLVRRRIHQNNESRRRGDAGKRELLEMAMAQLAKKRQ